MSNTLPPALSSSQDADIEFAKTQDISKDIPRKRLGPKNSQDAKESIDKLYSLLKEYYSVDKIVKFLDQKTDAGDYKFKEVALQFPDDLVRDSAIVCDLLQESLPGDRRVWVLADTSYSPCCIDEVAGEHIGADLILHFGEACLNPVEKINSAYIFGKPYLDFAKVVEIFRKQYSDKDGKICIMTGTQYGLYLQDIYETLKEEYTNLVFADVDLQKSGPNSTVIDRETPTEGTGLEAYDISRMIYGLNPDQILSMGEDDDYSSITQDYDLFYIGTPPDPKLILLSTKFSSVAVVNPFSLEVSGNRTPSLSRRYRFMMIARNASTIGILVNTLSLQNTRKLLNKVVKWVKDAGKKHYMFVVGKPNVAKLANFDTIDVWCILGCGQSGIIIDSYGDYYKPIITPYELQLALLPEVSWTGKWVVDFKEVMSQPDYQDGEENSDETGRTTHEEQDEEKDEYAPEFDPVTGRLVASRPLRQLRHLQIELGDQRKAIKNSNDEKSLTTRFSSELSIGNTVSTSALQLQNHTWTGLGSDYKQQEEDEQGNFSEEGAKVEEGRSGIARDYDYDRETDDDINNRQ